MKKPILFRKKSDLFLHSAVARGAVARLVLIVPILACLWLAVAWAVALP